MQLIPRRWLPDVQAQLEADCRKPDAQERAAALSRLLQTAVNSRHRLTEVQNLASESSLNEASACLNTNDASTGLQHACGTHDVIFKCILANANLSPPYMTMQLRPNSPAFSRLELERKLGSSLKTEDCTTAQVLTFVTTRLQNEQDPVVSNVVHTVEAIPVELFHEEDVPLLKKLRDGIINASPDTRSSTRTAVANIAQKLMRKRLLVSTGLDQDVLLSFATGHTVQVSYFELLL